MAWRGGAGRDGAWRGEWGGTERVAIALFPPSPRPPPGPLLRHCVTLATRAGYCIWTTWTHASSARLYLFSSLGRKKKTRIQTPNTVLNPVELGKKNQWQDIAMGEPAARSRRNNKTFVIWTEKWHLQGGWPAPRNFLVILARYVRPRPPARSPARLLSAG